MSGAVVLSLRWVALNTAGTHQHRHAAHRAHNEARVDIVQAGAVDAATHHRRTLRLRTGFIRTPHPSFFFQISTPIAHSAFSVGNGGPNGDSAVENEVLAQEQSTVRECLQVPVDAALQLINKEKANEKR